MWIYVASSWRNQLHPVVVLKLRQAGHHVFDFRHPAPGTDGFSWADVDPSWQQWSPAELRQGLEHPVAARGFEVDMNGMLTADACVLVLPCGRSAHLEAGWFAGQGRRLAILLADGEEPELMYRMAGLVTDDLDEIVSWLGKAA